MSKQEWNMYKYLRKLLMIVIALPVLSCARDGKDCDYLPRTPESSPSVYVVNLSGRSADEQLAVMSLQGIANRERAEIYTYLNKSCGMGDYWLEMYRRKGYITETQEYDDVYELIRLFKDKLKGIVVTDPECSATVNLASNIAGTEDCIIASPSNLETIRNVTGKPVLFDLREYGFKGQYDAFVWYKKNIFPKQRHDVLASAVDKCYRASNCDWDIFRDYLIEFRIPTFWIPATDAEDYDARYEKEVIKMLKETPVNIPLLGFWYWPVEGEEGISEFDGVKFIGKYGKFLLVNTDAGNYSYHSGVHTRMKKYVQTKSGNGKRREYDPDARYVALIMNESGDAPCYFLYDGFYPRQWNDPDRGKVPLSYGITPSLRMLAPAVLEDIYENKTDNDYFFTSISGAGYCYPFEGYGSLTENPEKTADEYFNGLTARNMKIMDHEMLGLYTHSGGSWSDADRALAEHSIYGINGLKSVISGMHRIAYVGEEANEMHGDVSLHHTVTFWSYDDLTWNDTSKDSVAVDHMENEIRKYGGESHFIQAMFYSWHYGPRRLNQLKERLEPDGYVFVTLDEFDRLYRESINDK